ncbi:MAG: hypothetical protein MJ136_06595, partial [Clostridia bacterium]|nr:hypothetical protein [Clostridia bacterium]
ETDAASTDAGETDAASTDAGETDAASTDAGETDAASTDAGEAIAAGTAADFNGSWVCVEFNVNGVAKLVSSISVDEMQMMFSTDEIRFLINDGTVSIFGQEPIEFTFENGALILHENILPATLTLTDNGYLNADLMGIVFICTAE